MKGITIGLACLLLGMLMLLAPRTAQAEDPIDCTNGCVIVTCNGATCTVWSCDKSGCSVIGHYYPKNSQRQAKAGSKSKPPKAFDAMCREGERCAIKTCEDGACEVSLFDGTAFVPVASVDDLDVVIDHAAKALDRL